MDYPTLREENEILNSEWLDDIKARWLVESEIAGKERVAERRRPRFDGRKNVGLSARQGSLR